MLRRYAVVLTPEPDGSAYNATVPALPGCGSWGATVEEALAMSRDAIETFLGGEPAAEWPEPVGVVVAEADIPIVEHRARLARVGACTVRASA